MKLALGIVSLFAGGGLQRDALRVLEVLRRRGHDVSLFTGRCDTSLQTLHAVTILRPRGFSNHAFDQSFAQLFQAATREGYDAVVGFNKLTGLDVLYCADPSVLAGPLSPFQRGLPRHRARRRLEEACFGANAATQILMLSEPAAATYQRIWQTPTARITILPPTVAANRIRPGLRTQGNRASQRAKLGATDNDVVWLWIASQPQTKGLDRALHALSQQAGARLVIAGLAQSDGKAKPFARLAGNLNIAPRVSWLGHREDICELMAAADLLLHPARFDTTGQVILESIVNGLPVVTTAACGFAGLVDEARAGVVLAEPFDAGHLARALDLANDPNVRQAWSRQALQYAAQRTFIDGFERAADVIERIAARRRGSDTNLPTG